MPVLVVGTEKSFTALRRRLFAGRVSSTNARAVAEAVARANPHADLGALEPGTVLSIPDLPQLGVRGELSLAADAGEGIDALAAAAAQVLEELIATARSRQREDAAERKRLARALDAKEVAAAVREDRALAADVEAVRRAVEEEDARAKEGAASLKRAQAEWNAELDAVRKLF